jgi:hypothetical protein
LLPEGQARRCPPRQLLRRRGLLAVIKGERDNLSGAERNELRKELSGIAEDYRAGERKMIAELRTGRPK